MQNLNSAHEVNFFFEILTNFPSLCILLFLILMVNIKCFNCFELNINVKNIYILRKNGYLVI